VRYIITVYCAVQSIYINTLREQDVHVHCTAYGTHMVAPAQYNKEQYINTDVIIIKKYSNPITGLDRP
jgi:hypothetical protein